MPTYEYKCRSCEHQFEVIQSIKDDALSECPECGKDEAERQISGGGGLIFKGSGFYITDYRSASYKKDAKNDKPKTDKSESKSKTDTSKSDSKSTADKPKSQSSKSPSKSSGD